MTKIELEIHDDVVSTLIKIKDINDTGIELDIPEGSVLFENILNIRLLEKKAEDMGKVLHFKTYDEAGLNLIASVKDEGSSGLAEIPGINDDQESQEVTTSLGNTVVKTPERLPREFAPTAVSLPKIGFPKINLNKIKGTPVYIFTALGIILLLGGGAVFAAKAPKAQVKIIVSPQTLTKSVSVKVKNGASTSTDNKILRGFNVEVETTQTQSIDTTGEKIVGEKAEGKVKIFNFTSSDIELEKGTELEYKDYKFILNDDITIPAQTVDTTTPQPTSTPGSEEAEVTASNFGEEYNISKDKSMEVDDYKTSEVVATSIESFKGGSSKKVKVVAKEDMTNLASKALTANQEAGQTALKNKLGSNQELITGSTKSILIKEEFNAKEGEEKDKLEITQTIKTLGLVYSSDEMDTLMNDLVKSLIPEGYELTEKDREINAEVLGNSDTSELSSDEADLQVTLKTFVIPEIKEEQIKQDLAGKGISDAEKVLGSIRNVKTYSLDISPNIPFMNKVPKNLEFISVEIHTEE